MNKLHLKIIIMLLLITVLLSPTSNTYCFADSLESKLSTENTYTTQKINSPQNNEIEILSFNTLMAFPEKALNENNNMSITYDETKITPNEFTSIIEQLYKNDYILVDIYDVLDKETGQTKKLYLPENKKPIILTFENVTYKSNYQNLGEIDKIIIDRNNNLASYTTKKSIQDRIQYDNEFILILENFYKEHPDFSFNQAKGIIFLSGENGILGYNTNHKNASSKYEAKRVAEVIKKLKSLGWKFGSNNYTYALDSTKSDLEFAKDLSLWNQEIKSIVGSTNLYSFPYGENCENDKNKLELLATNGFNFFFINSFKCDISQSGNICFLSKKEISGNTLRKNHKELNHLFDSSLAYDKEYRTTPYPINE